jgi:hypothetical protein
VSNQPVIACSIDVLWEFIRRGEYRSDRQGGIEDNWFPDARLDGQWDRTSVE